MNVAERLRVPQAPLRLPRWLAVGGMTVIVGYLLVSPLIAAPFVNFDRSMVMVYLIVGLGLNLLTGFTGQISLGHGAFFALGAYLAAVLINEQGWPYLAVLPAAAVVSWIVGYLVGRPALRLHGLQLALVTLALALITPSVIKRFDHVTKGQEGINLDTAMPPAWMGLERDQWVFYLCFACAAVTLIVSSRLASGRIGRSLVAIRDNEPVATTLGVRPEILKTQVFALSAACAGVAGALYAFVVQFVAPEAFGLTLAIAFVTLIVVGGLGSTFGSVFGAIFVVYVPDLTAGLNQSAAGLTYGLSLVIFMFLLPAGVIGLVRTVVNPLTSRWRTPAPRSTGVS
ncbi:MAG: branched-chain amino acid ABC transporter permease [Aeromicrobium sp.]